MSNEYDIAQIYKDMEQELISSMQRNLAGHIEEEKEVGFNYPQWQAEKLKSLRKYQIENAKTVSSYTDGLPTKVKAILQDELKQGALHELELFKEALAAGYESAVVMNESFFKINTRKVNALLKSINKDMAKANQACLRYTDDAYRRVIFQSEMYVTNGVFTEKKAIEKALQDFEKRGIQCIQYADGSYRHIADYTDMAIKTASQRAYLTGEGEMRKKIGNTLIRISKHGGTCPLCAKWEDKILIDDVYSGGTRADGDYPLLSEAMAAGLYHPRCRHGCGTYYPEIEDINNENHLQNSQDSDNMLFRKGYTHRKTNVNGNTIIDEPLYNKLTSKAIKQGANIVKADKNWERHLLENKATAVTIGDTIIFSKEPTVSDVIEEITHFYQNKQGLYADYPFLQRQVMCEIDAKQYLISVEQKYNIPKNEMKVTKQQLKELNETKSKMKKAGEWID